MRIEEERVVLQNTLKERLKVADRNARRYRRLNNTFLVMALLFGLLATALATDSARGGNHIGKPVAEATTGKAPAELPKGWRNVCGWIAVMTLIGTIASGLKRR